MQSLNNYLYQNKSISIPGLGTLHMERIPARTDFVNRQLLPPGYTFRFDKYFDAPGKDFFSYISSVKHLTDYDAIKWYNEFAYELRSRIRNREQAVWEGLGTFHSDDNGEIYFEADRRYELALGPVTAERVIRENMEHHLLVGDRERTTGEMPELLTHTESKKDSWWIYAIVIAAIALSLCAVGFMRNGFRFFSSGNQQTVPAYQMPVISR
ncbi:hypothetical protein [Flavihumibacter solisilvae]|uniref:Uncharacterized protein n=1 Tax=Flavihumibacter solisilvae TaxID=1349421 RepID=A0A0C1LGN9_9BACT|nr:hypothetical protein [Flavihumibacter solisilvae]KIC94483.1 hypothetical protein OI18_11450 [Flavihumibacter solisilvae]